MIFIETSVFEEQINELLSHDEYLAFQKMLAGNPTAGDLIKGSGGLRKIRWSLKGAGKRGGIRVIYYHVTAAYQIRLLLAYKKGVQDDLTPAQLKMLRRIVEAWEE
jgi:mRNA-degrading endonuclease RelE of RelBE toxin-antitoxin system